VASPLIFFRILILILVLLSNLVKAIVSIFYH
jgi:hypothetical protein